MERRGCQSRKLRVPERSSVRTTIPQKITHPVAHMPLSESQTIPTDVPAETLEPVVLPISPRKKPWAAPIPSQIRSKPAPSKTSHSKQRDYARLNRYLSKAAKKSDLLSQSLELSQQQGQKRLLVKPSLFSHVRVLFSRHALSGLIVAVLVVAGYISVDTWIVNRRVTHEVMASDKSGDTATSHQEQEGKDETPMTTDRLNSYKVAADMPRLVYIDALNVRARTLPMGVNTDGSMQAPINIFDAGWYSNSSKPGEVGAVVINAHASGRLREGLFAYIDTIQSGDSITIEKGDGSTVEYRVVQVEEVPLDQVDMAKVLLPYGTTTRGLNLITCSGSYDKASSTYDHRTIVYAEQVG